MHIVMVVRRARTSWRSYACDGGNGTLCHFSSYVRSFALHHPRTCPTCSSSSILISFRAVQGVFFSVTGVDVRIRYRSSWRRSEWRRRFVMLIVSRLRHTTRVHTTLPIFLRPRKRWGRTRLLLHKWAFTPVSGPGDWWRRLVV